MQHMIRWKLLLDARTVGTNGECNRERRTIKAGWWHPTQRLGAECALRVGSPTGAAALPSLRRASLCLPCRSFCQVAGRGLSHSCPRSTLDRALLAALPLGSWRRPCSCPCRRTQPLPSSPSLASGTACLTPVNKLTPTRSRPTRSSVA